MKIDLTKKEIELLLKILHWGQMVYGNVYIDDSEEYDSSKDESENILKKIHKSIYLSKYKDLIENFEWRFLTPKDSIQKKAEDDYEIFEEISMYENLITFLWKRDINLEGKNKEIFDQKTGFVFEDKFLEIDKYYDKYRDEFSENWIDNLFIKEKNPLFN